MQYRIVINLAVCAFSCFVANDLATDIYGERCKRVLLNILTNAVYVFLLMDMMLFPYAMILFPVIVFLGFMALSVNYNVDKKKCFDQSSVLTKPISVLIFPLSAGTFAKVYPSTSVSNDISTSVNLSFKASS